MTNREKAIAALINYHVAEPVVSNITRYAGHFDFMEMIAAEIERVKHRSFSEHEISDELIESYDFQDALEGKILLSIKKELQNEKMRIELSTNMIEQMISDKAAK